MNTLLCWGLSVIWAFTWCVVLPAVVLPYSKETLRFFPEAIGVPAIMVMGWVPSLLVCLLACLWYNLRDQTSEQIRSRRPHTWADPMRAARQRSHIRRRPASVIEEKKHYSPSSGTGGSSSVLLFAFCLPLFFGGSFGLFLCFFSCIS